MTFGVIGSSFFGNVSNCWLNSYSKFGGATRHRFSAICEKPEGGGRITAPGRARVKIVSEAKDTSNVKKEKLGTNNNIGYWEPITNNYIYIKHASHDPIVPNLCL